MKGRLLADVSKKETDGVFALISHTLSIFGSISNIACQKELLKFNLLFPNSDLIEPREKCLTILVSWS